MFLVCSNIRLDINVISCTHLNVRKALSDSRVLQRNGWSTLGSRFIEKAHYFFVMALFNSPKQAAFKKRLIVQV